MPRFSPRQWAIFVVIWVFLALATAAAGFVFGRRILNPSPPALPATGSER